MKNRNTLFFKAIVFATISSSCGFVMLQFFCLRSSSFFFCGGRDCRRVVVNFNANDLPGFVVSCWLVGHGWSQRDFHLLLWLRAEHRLCYSGVRARLWQVGSVMAAIRLTSSNSEKAQTFK